MATAGCGEGVWLIRWSARRDQLPPCVPPQARKTEDDKYVEIKAQLRQDIRQLQEKVLGMIASNEGQPDMERLERHEFILDMEEHQRLQLEEEAQIDAVRLPHTRGRSCRGSW